MPEPPDDNSAERKRTAALEETTRLQARATAPHASAWVCANAGTGKTYVLVRRVLNLLLSGAAPESLLCLTFTKAAAAEMANRLMDELGRWAVCSEPDLRGRLSDLTQRPLEADTLMAARRLFARVLEAPGGLKIQTIHAFCERILRQFPLEAGLAPGFHILTEEDARLSLREATEAVLWEASAANASELGQALEVVASRSDESGVYDMVRAALAERERVAGVIRHCQDAGISIRDWLADGLGLAGGYSEENLARRQAELVPQAELLAAVAMLERMSAKTDRGLAARLRAAAQAMQNTDDPIEQALALAPVFLTATGQERADTRFMTKKARENAPALAERLSAAKTAFAELEEKRRALAVAQASAALIALADAVFTRYAESKSADGALDYDDLISKTLGLLSDRGANAWVQYRLDGGLDHLLIDEAQDTSPAQWEVVARLTEDFFAGQGVRETGRTIFAVGDEKQSIYGFQGAAPEHFAARGSDYAGKARNLGQDWHDLRLGLSFRSTTPVLRATDLVFAGMDGEFADMRHDANRAGHGGLVELWPVEQAEPVDAQDPWEPVPEKPASGAPVPDGGPAERLASRIADQIAAWLAGGERLAARGRAVRPGDIAILVRKRRPFADIMIKALKARGIPVAGADRMRLIEQIAVKDLMALGDCLLLAGDDLTLASVLKSPIFGLDDDDLFTIGYGREGGLWEALASAAENNETYAGVYVQLEHWRTETLTRTPFDFFSARLEEDGARLRLLARLGAEAADALDEFLSCSLDYEAAGAAPSLQGFLHWLCAGQIELRRDMDRAGGEVRVMTVHGAKGLEADIVFLPDTCSTRGAGGGAFVPVTKAGARPGEPDMLLWPIAGAGSIPAIAAAKDRLAAAERREYLRLLYVAMTRARDRLYVCGFTGARGRDSGCWHELVETALGGVAERADDNEGRSVLRLSVAQERAPDAQKESKEEKSEMSAPPAWTTRPVAQENAPEPLTPSRARPPSPSPADDDGAEDVRLSGVLTHELLSRLPEFAPEARAEAAQALAKRYGADLPEQAQARIIARALEILSQPQFAHFFGPGSRAEVPVAARISASSQPTAHYEISGRIDRLALHGREVLIVDYKTGRRVPRAAAEVPPAHGAQLAAYGAAVAPLFPGYEIRLLLLYTEGPALIEVTGAPFDNPTAALDASTQAP